MAVRNPCVCDERQYGTHTEACREWMYRPAAEASARRIAEKHRVETAVVKAARVWARARESGDVAREEVAAVELANEVLGTDDLWYPRLSF